MKRIIIAITLLLSSVESPCHGASSEPVGARFPATGYAIDAGLWMATYSMERYWDQPSGLRDFPTSSIDHKVRASLHGSEVDADYNDREMTWRHYSDAGSIAVPFMNQDQSSRNLSLVSRAFAINNFATTLLKNAVHRSRPKPTLNSDVHQDGDNAKSFPSGHSSNAMVAATSLVLLTPNQSPAVHAGIYALGASIGLARIMADRHFLTDVLVGGALGYWVTRAVFEQEDGQGPIVAGVSSLGFRFVF